MNTRAIKDYYHMIYTFEIIIHAINWIQHEKDDWSYSEIVEISEKLLYDMRVFGINNVGDVEGCMRD